MLQSDTLSSAPLSPPYPDLPLDGYQAQPYFHQIDGAWPGVQLINEDPYIIICQDFLTGDECAELIKAFSLSTKQASSSRFLAQTTSRTSTSVVQNDSDVSWLRYRIAALTRCSTNQLQATKITRYEKGQFFRKHTDAAFSNAKREWWERLVSGKESAEQLKATGEHMLPERFCTVFIYLNDVAEGGCTRWKSRYATDDLYDAVLPKLGETFGKKVPGVPKSRSEATMDVTVQPKAGMAVVHFPTTTPEYMGLWDPLAVHESEDAVDPKYIVQQFIWSASLDECSRIVGSTGDPARWAEKEVLLRQVMST